MSDTKKDNYGRLIAQKTEKLVAGLYLVSDIIDSSDPIKNELKKNAICLLSSVSVLQEDEIKDIYCELASASVSIKKILSFIHIGTLSGSISEMNGRLLTESFKILSVVLQKKRQNLTLAISSLESGESLIRNDEIPTLSSDAFFEESTKEKMYGDINAQIEIKDTIHGMDAQKQVRVSSPSSYLTQVRSLPPLLNEDVLQVEKQVNSFERKVAQGVFKARKLSRRDQIMGLFIRGVDMSIKDISSKIKGCSEKTIQRELNALVFDHIIERVGEKRWSRYVQR